MRVCVHEPQMRGYVAPVGLDCSRETYPIRYCILNPEAGNYCVPGVTLPAPEAERPRAASPQDFFGFIGRHNTDDLIISMVHASREHPCARIWNKGLTCGYGQWAATDRLVARASQRREWRHDRQTVPRPLAQRRARRHGDRTHVPRPMLGRKHAQYGELVSWHRRHLLSSALPLRAGRCRGSCRGHFGAQATRGDYIVEGHRRRHL